MTAAPPIVTNRPRSLPELAGSRRAGVWLAATLSLALHAGAFGALLGAGGAFQPPVRSLRRSMWYWKWPMPAHRHPPPPTAPSRALRNHLPSSRLPAKRMSLSLR